MALFSENLNNASQLYLAERLTKHGGRPSIVADLCGIKIRRARDIYGDVFGHQAPSGKLPSDKHWILRGSINCIHASIFFSSYRIILSEIGDFDALNYAHALVTAFDIYHSHCLVNEDAFKLDINRAYDIVRQERNGDLSMALCGTCRSNHIVLGFYPDQLKGCPICHAWTNADGRVSWMNTNAMSYQKSGRQRPGKAKKRLDRQG